MYPLMIGMTKESHAMTAATAYQAMIAITVNTAIGTIARRAAHIAGCVIPLFVWAVRTNVPHVTSRFAGSALQHARNAKRRFARTV